MQRNTSAQQGRHSSSVPKNYSNRSEKGSGGPVGIMEFAPVINWISRTSSKICSTWYGNVGLFAAVAGVGILVGKAGILDLLSPFGLAYMFAVLYWRRQLTVSALTGVSVGQLLLNGPQAALHEALLLAAFWLIAEVLCDVEKNPPSLNRLLMAAGGAAIVVRGFVWFSQGTTIYYLFLFVFELVMMLCSCVVFARGLRPIFSSTPQHLHDAGDHVYQLWIGQTLISVIILSTVVLMGMSGWEIGGQRVVWILALLSILLCAARAGVWGGMVAGAVIGGCLGFAVQLDLPLAAALMAGGLLAGVARRWGYMIVVIAMVTPVLGIYSILAPSRGWLFTPWEMLFAVGLYTVTCAALPELESQFAPAADAAAEMAATAGAFFYGRTDAAGQIRRTESTERTQRSRQDWDFNSGSMTGSSRLEREDLRADRLLKLLRSTGDSDDENTNERLKAFARVFRRLADSFSEISRGEQEESGPDVIARVVERVGCQVCSNCRRYSQCWQKKFMFTYQSMCKILLQLDVSDWPSYGEVEENLKSMCPENSEALFKIMHSAYKTEQINHRWSVQFAETKDLAATQFRGLAKMMDELAQGLQKKKRNRREGKLYEKRMRYEAGVADIAHGDGPSGDTHLIRKLDGEELVVMLSDGMGAGGRAAQESQAAVLLLEELLQVGLDRESALKTVNSVLVLRSTEDVFATVDMMSVDLYSGGGEFTKIGAAPTFVKRGREVLCIASGVVPSGILSEVALESTTRQLQPGDTVIMMTDGIMAALGSLTETQKKTWISRFLTGSNHESAEDLATALVAQTASFCPDGPPDDMTVVALRLLERQQ